MIRKPLGSILDVSYNKEELITSTTDELLNLINKEIKKIRTYTPKIGIFGDTGVGKSSLCNALFGKDVAKISNVEACTREPQKILIGDIQLIDVPGVGEDPERHQEYINLYKSLLPELDLVIWAIKADDRKYASAIEVYEDILKPNLEKCPVVFAITQIDKVEPYREWDIENNKPSEKQIENIIKKQMDISERFKTPIRLIKPISSQDKYGLKELVSTVVEVLPNEKKSSFVRETKDENLSKEAILESEKGIFYFIKEKFGEVWDSVKDRAVDVIVATAVKNAPKLIDKGVKLLKSLFK